MRNTRGLGAAEVVTIRFETAPDLAHQPYYLVRQASAEELYEFERIGTGIAFEERTANPTYKKPAHLSLPRVKEHMKVTALPVFPHDFENSKEIFCAGLSPDPRAQSESQSGDSNFERLLSQI